APEHVHATVVHELGHVVENIQCPDGSPAWSDYLARRGLESARFSSDAIHRDRPREIFAEDFRFLRGDALATSSGSIENPTLPLPFSVPGLPDFLARLSDRPLLVAPAARVAPFAAPNPFLASAGESVRIRFSAASLSGSRVPADVFDALGRRVRSLSGTAS